MKMDQLSDIELLGVLVGEREARNLLQDGLDAVMRAASLRAREPLRIGEMVCDGYVDSKSWTALDRVVAASELVMRVTAQEATMRPTFHKPEGAMSFARSKIGDLPHEVFMMIYLDCHHHLILCEELFRGTVNQTAVYRREIIKRCLDLNASAVFLAHNHPSGVLEPSRDDEVLTANVVAALRVIDVAVLDHFIVGPMGTTSFAQRGLL